MLSGLPHLFPILNKRYYHNANRQCILFAAEMNAIKAAMKMTGEKVLDSCEMYVTVEPCAMCAGAIANARIRRVYIGCEEPKTGCMGSVTNLANMLPHKCEVYYGFCEDECKSIMKKFFESKRKITD